MDTVLKEAPDFSQAVRWKLLDIIVVLVFRIISAHSNDLVICLSLINHRHKADGLCPKETAWNNWLLHTHKSDI